MANIRKLPSGKFNLRIREKGKPLISVTRDTESELQEWLRDYEADNALPLSVASVAPDYLQSVMVRDGKMRGGYESIYFKLNQLSKFLPQKPLEALTKEDVITYRETRLEAVAGSTVRLEIQLLSRLLRWAAEEKGVKCGDVTQGVKLPPHGKSRDRIVSELEYQMILDRVSERAKPAVILAYETAMRRNEILSITPAMFDRNKSVIRLSETQTKNGCSRDVPLNKKAVELLTELCKGRDENSRIITLTPYALSQAWRRGAELAGVGGTCFHTLRHTAITRAAEKGLSISQLSIVSGHKSLAMLQRYTHIKAETVAALLD